jgi:hypothetical protein
MAKRTAGPFETTPEHYEDTEVIRPGLMAEYYQFLDDEEKAFYRDVVTMYDDPFKRKAAGEVAIGIIEARRINEGRSPRRTMDIGTRVAEGFSGQGMSSNRRRIQTGDRLPQNSIEGQRLAETFPEALEDNDFMRLSIARIVEEGMRPERSIPQQVEDSYFKYIRDNDPGGFDQARSPMGRRFEPTPPPGFEELGGAAAAFQGGRPIEEEAEVPDAALRPEDARKRRERKKKNK